MTFGVFWFKYALGRSLSLEENHYTSAFVLFNYFGFDPRNSLPSIIIDFVSLVKRCGLKLGETALSYCYIPSRNERDDSVSRQIYLTFHLKAPSLMKTSLLISGNVKRESSHHCFFVCC